MASDVRPIPPGYRTITPFLRVRGAAKALEFYATAFGAEILTKMETPDGGVMHAELKFGDSIVMLGEEMAGYPGPQMLGGASGGLLIYCADVDALFNRAVAAGATAKSAPDNQFWGDRHATLVDPFGNEWGIATHVEDVSPAELERRAAQYQP